MAEPEKTLEAELADLDAAIEAQEALRGTVPDSVMDTTLAALRGQRAALCSQIAQTVGSGSTVQGDHSAGAGRNGVAIAGDVYFGDPPRNAAEALDRYRAHLIRTARRLSLVGVDPDASDAACGRGPRTLDRIYVELNTKTMVSEEAEAKPGKGAGPDGRDDARPLSALEAAVRHSRLVIVGEPGSGKSTFLNHLCLCLAHCGQSDPPGPAWRERIAAWPDTELGKIPIPVVLRDFGRWLLTQPSEKAAPRHLWDFIESHLNKQNLEYAAVPLREALEKGKAVLLLDGLDEVPSDHQRTFVRRAVERFVREYEGCRAIVTCRVLSYRQKNAGWRLSDFEDTELAPLDADRIDRFIGYWYGDLKRKGELSAEDADSLDRRLRRAVRRKDLKRLAPNPLLLTVMAVVHTHKGRLPENRARLYEEAVDVLLWRWERGKVAGTEEVRTLDLLLQDVNCAEADLKRTLGELAFGVHGRAGDGDELADIPEYDLQEALRALHPNKSWDWAHEVIGAMKLRAGILLERDRGLYTFPHRTFQEYLAAAYLAVQGDFVEQAVDLTRAGHFWREVILLAVGYLIFSHSDHYRPLALAGGLCPDSAPNTETGWRRVWLAGEVIGEMGVSRAEKAAGGPRLVNTAREMLKALMEAGALTPTERVAAGNTLAEIGDPRFDPEYWYLPVDPMRGFKKIEAGTFRMGSDKEHDPNTYGDETPRHQVTLPDYLIARYPVTVAQFRAFVEDSGYQPGNSNCLRGVANHPVVRISWHEANRYCQWLTERLKADEKCPEPLAGLIQERGWVIRLPSEAEWEKAARGDDGRIYPWGREPDPGKANYGDTGIRTTSPVGCFPDGAGPHEIFDMAGNVWEWTGSVMADYPYKPGASKHEENTAEGSCRRVLRGGSFDGYRLLVRCAARDRDYPLNWLDDIGFRLACAPGKTPLGL